MKKNNPQISYIIPHFGRDDVLMWHLSELNNQVFKEFEVIVVVDADEDYDLNINYNILNYPARIIYSGRNGPATARNIGAENALSDVLLFVGSDCIPDSKLILYHYGNHMLSQVSIVQGYTPWHSDVVTEFYDFLDASGLQAAWVNLRDGDKWRDRVSASFCLTTNYSIKKKLFLNEGGFDESFSGAAWEDVELGYRLNRKNISAIFSPRAINYHYHRYDLDSFAARSRMEGYHRLTLSKLHPEMSWNLTNSFELRTAKEIDEYAILKWAKELELATYQDNDSDIQLKNIYFSRMLECCKTWSMHGILDRIRDEHPAMQALIHIHKPEQSIQIISGAMAMDSGRYGYASHCAQWFVTDVPDNWAAWSFWGETELARGNVYDGLELFKQSLSINPGAAWPKNRIKELT